MKRVRVPKKWQKVISCSGTKIVRYIVVSVFCAAILPGCVTPVDACWEAYCREYGVNAKKPTIEQENYYYDVWLETDAALKYMEND